MFRGASANAGARPGAFCIAMFFGKGSGTIHGFSAEKARQGEMTVQTQTHRITTAQDVHRDVMS
ncbi:hypothetical protein [Mesorhizobium temperatum]|uniref:Uncharacterized protein n=1 Tax=Mesorhizobium temperatum TaxID=241416 RepID=A0A271LVA5_9HYPH|nr:hypothetical protein [Mesorhizobium temperatum]PAQ12092.1 hypothetical protein CIT26_01600 [Mesorhizobium temperatum]